MNLTVRTPLGPAAALACPAVTGTAAAAVTIAAPMPTATGAKRPRLSPRTAFYLEASITLGFLAGSAAPTPLYAVYRAQWGFSPTMLTVAFGIYAIAVLAALLIAGRLSDHVGRRPVLIAAAVAQALVMVTFATAQGLGDLLVGRVLQGLSAGVALAAVGAALLDLDKQRGAIANAVAPMLGTGLGGFVAGLMVQYLPAPTHLVYEVLGVVFVLQAVALAFVAETAMPRPGALASLRPTFALPPAVRGPLLSVAPAVVALWALAGFYASLGPTLVRELVGSGSFVVGGLALFVMAGSGAVAVLALRAREAQHLLRIGAVALLGGVVVVLASLSLDSLVVFMIGTAIAGAGFGIAFQGAIRTVVAAAAPTERAGVLSLLFVLSYLAMGAPAIVAGARFAATGDIISTAREFGVAILALAALALFGTRRVMARQLSAPPGRPPAQRSDEATNRPRSGR
jgi:predicted MFS family arabinose efflux permease